MTIESEFRLDDAIALAAIAYRTSAPGPWVGKEAALLDALRLAELHHDTVLQQDEEEAEPVDDPKVKRQRVERMKQLSRSLRKSINLYRLLGDDQKLELIAPFIEPDVITARIESQIRGLIDSTNQEKLGENDDIFGKMIEIATAPGVQGLEGLFVTMGEVADRIDNGARSETRGRKGFLQPLEYFIDSLQDSWEQAGIEEAFSPEFLDGGEPESAAAILVVEAAKCLGQNYSGKNCQNAWRPRSGKRPVA